MASPSTIVCFDLSGRLYSMTKQRAKRRKNSRLRQSLEGAPPEVSPRLAAGESTNKAPPISPTEESIVSPLDLGLGDLLANAEDDAVYPPEDGAAETSLDSLQDEPPPLKKSAYAELADAEHWPALVRLCERDGLKTLLSQVWWIRAHVEAQSMPVELLQPSFERAISQEKVGEGAGTDSEWDEVQQVLRSCRRWFGIKDSSEELKVEKGEKGRPVEDAPKDAPQQPPVSTKSVSSLPPVSDIKSKEEQLPIAQHQPGEKKTNRWDRRVITVAILALIIGVFVRYFLPMRDDLVELVVSPIPNEPLPRVVPLLRHADLVPLTTIEVLQVAMDDLVNVREEAMTTDSPPPISSPPAAPSRQRAPLRPTPAPSREELIMDGPFEPASIGDLRLRPEEDPTAAERDRKAELPSVWDRVNPGSAPLATPTPSKSVTDFFEGFDDHPGHPVERYHTPQACELSDKAVIRTRPSELAPATAELRAGDTVMIDQRIGPWVRLQSKSGRPGFARANCRWEAKPLVESVRREEEWRR